MSTQVADIFFRWFPTQTVDPDEHRIRIRWMERNVGTLVKIALFIVFFQELFFFRWFNFVSGPRDAVMEVFRFFFLGYVIANIAVGLLLWGMDQTPLKLIQWVVFTNALLDSLFLAALTLFTGGFDSVLFWGFLGLIIRNTISMPEASLQTTLNILTILCYLSAGAVDIQIVEMENQLYGEGLSEYTQAEPFLMRLFLLIMMAVCGHGLQVLLDQQRRSLDEARVFAQRQAQLQATGRLAAEIAHQIKNPLGIINNAAYSLKRKLSEDQKELSRQAELIREEVERADRIITELMGYAQLAEGRVERLEAPQEIQHAIEQVFPSGSAYGVEVRTDFAQVLPPLMMQRSHFLEVIVNLLLNARDLLSNYEGGIVQVGAYYGAEYSVTITVDDNGPGVPDELKNHIFEPYFTTKEKGSGLGLAIVRHNTEMYGGTTQIEDSALGGARFVLNFPAKSVMRLQK